MECLVRWFWMRQSDFIREKKTKKKYYKHHFRSRGSVCFFLSLDDYRFYCCCYCLMKSDRANERERERGRKGQQKSLCWFFKLRLHHNNLIGSFRSSRSCSSQINAYSVKFTENLTVFIASKMLFLIYGTRFFFALSPVQRSFNHWNNSQFPCT